MGRRGLEKCLVCIGSEMQLELKMAQAAKTKTRFTAHTSLTQLSSQAHYPSTDTDRLKANTTASTPSAEMPRFAFT
eukprot:m.210409 g.210409  ORF g.210409 m.210409 type:complete len:76 (+) comp17143_c0_seq5:1467-1694(+)